MAEFPQIVHHGALNGVTGSCHEWRVDADHSLLIDCGLFQGAETSGKAGAEHLEIDFPIGQIKALIVTHVHIDHVGRIPYLLAAGFDGPIYCSEPSALLLPLVLEDAVKVGFTRDRKLVERFLSLLERRLRPLSYDCWQDLDLGTPEPVFIRLQRAGHILGSAYVECRAGGEDAPVTVFSGDLGAPWAPLLPAPRPPRAAHTVVLESTYGDRNHEDRRNRRFRLQEVLEHALADGGTVLIPAFSIGRTQDLLYELEDLIHHGGSGPVKKGLPWEDLEIVVDSPLASRFTEAYRKLKPFWDAEARQRLKSGRHPLSFEQLTTVDSHADHMHTVDYLAKSKRPCVVIAASGMCAGGRIVNYLKAMLGDARHDIVFVGYQARGTPGSDIQYYGPRGGYVMLDGRRYEIRARIHQLSGYSAHAGQKDLLNFVRKIPTPPAIVRLVHGDEDAKSELRRRLGSLLPGTRVEIPH
ncbi:MAG: MBL fold metallo-hydrolase [Chromatiales bacterium]|nr:MBL fold metallo-hydrolase [Chromatiales bacterium]